MAEINTVIAEASQDLQTIEDFVNLPAGSDVRPRLLPSVNVGTLAGTRDAIFEAGGLPATPFATKVLMEVSELVDGDYAMVTDDVITENNGLYSNQDGSWIKSSYDPAEIIRDYVNKSILSYFRSTIGKHTLFALTDASDAPMVVIKENGGVYLHGIEDNVQDILNKLQSNGKYFTKQDSSKKSAVLVVDASDNILAEIQEDGTLHLVGLEKPIQEYLSKFDSIQTELSEEESNTDDLVLYKDLLDNVVASIDKEGGVRLTGLEKTVQESLIATEKDIEGLKTTLNTEVLPAVRSAKKEALYYKDIDLDGKTMVSPESIEVLKTGRALYSKTAPILDGTLPQPYTIGDSWVDDIKIETGVEEDHIVFAGYDPLWREDIGVVHPQVWCLREASAGYKYWLSINPYTNGNEAIELPFLYGSNDPELRDWTLIDGFPIPFEEDPITESGSYRGHLSDSAMTYDPTTGDIVYFWRKTLYWDENSDRGRTKDSIYRASRYNGETWSELYDLIPSGAAVSPSIIYNPADKLFYLYEQGGNKVTYRTCPHLKGGDWSTKKYCTLTHQEGKIWHLEAKYIGEQVVLLLHGDNFMSNKVEGDVYYFAVSSDFVNFRASSDTIVSNPNPEIYKASFVPIWVSDTEAKMRIIYTSDSQNNPQYKFYVTDSNVINLGVL